MQDAEFIEYQDSELTNIPASSILSLFATDKAQRSTFALQVLSDLQGGYKDPLEVHLQLKAMENLIEMFTDKKKYPSVAKAYSELLMDAAAKHGKSFQFHNSTFSTTESGTKYDWEKCNDPEILELMAQAKDIEKKVKKRQDFLKMLPDEGIDVLYDTGETKKIYRPAKSSTTTLSVTLS